MIIIDPKMILRVFSGQADLSKTQSLDIYKLTGIVVVSEDKNIILATF